jgi:hypothetical protein
MMLMVMVMMMMMMLVMQWPPRNRGGAPLFRASRDRLAPRR